MLNLKINEIEFVIYQLFQNEININIYYINK